MSVVHLHNFTCVFNVIQDRSCRRFSKRYLMCSKINTFAMCIIMAKYLPNLGWVGIKNRDRGYYPIINIKKSRRGGLERLYIWDETTGYTEGLNEHRICIISASMATVSDEKGQGTTTHEGTRGDYMSPDGKKIRKALMSSNCKDALRSLVDEELTGHTLVFDSNKCYMLESGWRNHQFIHKIEEIHPSTFCVRTNHGILLPWAGYQRLPDDPGHSRKRVSSEIRKIKAELGLHKANSLDEAIECILDCSESNPQMNPCRLDDRNGYMKTTGQLALVPSQLTLYYRPIWSGIKFDYEELNGKDEKCFFEVLSQRPLYTKN